MEKNSHQELIQWDEELQTNISKGFCSPDDVLNLSGEQVRTRLLQQNSGGEGLHVSGKGEMSGGTSCLLECEQSLAGVPPLLRTTPISRSRVEFESHYPDPRGYKPLEQQTHVGHKEPIHPDPRPVGAKLGPALTHPILTENLTSAPNRCSQSSSFSSCLPENILDGINLNTSVVGGKELLTAYIQEEQDMHTLNTVRSAAVEGILYGFDLSCERSGNEYTPLDQMTYEYDVTCGEEVQYTSLDPVSYSFDVSCEPDEDVNTLVDPMSYEFEVSCARDDDSMECFNQSTLNDGKEDVMTSMVRGAKTPGNSHGALGSWSETELVIGSPEHQSNSGSSTVTTVRNEGSSSVTATTVISVIASREEMLPEVEVHQTTSVVKGNTPAEMKRSPDGDEPTTVCYHQYLSTSQDKEPCQSEMDECFSEQRVDGSVEPANTLVANYTPSFCQAASWDCATTTAADSGGNPSRSTSKISTECDVESSGASSAHQPQKSFSSLDGESPDLSASDSTEGPNPSGQLVQTTEEDTDTIQPAFSLFANEREKSWGSPANQKGDVLTEPPLVKTVGPSREEQPDDEVPESPAANTSSLFSLHVSTARQHSPLSPASMETIYRSAEKTFRTENPGRTEQVVRTSSDSEGTSKKLCLPEHEEKSISKDSREPGLAPMASVSVVSKVQNNEPLNNCSENSEASQEKVRHQNENGEQGTGEQQIWESKQLAVEIGTTCRESAMVSVAGAEETLEAQVNIPDKHEVSKLQGIGMDCQLQYAKPVLKPATEPASGRVHNGEEDLKMTSAEVVGAFGEPPLYTCTKCSVYFQDKEFLHRHMLDHFDVHSGEGLGGGLRPFSCQECGHCFCDPASLQSHMSLHQARRASFMEAIQELAEPRGKEHGVRPQCPQSRFGADLSISVEEHVETHAHADPHTREVQVATADLRDHALLYHPDSFRDGKTLTLSNPRMLPQASKINLHTGKEYPSIRRDEMGCVKYGQQSLYQQKASCPLSSSAWLSADQESEDLHAQPDKREIPQKFPLSSLDPQPERGSLPSVAKNPCQYQAKHLVLKGDWKSKMALETSGNKFKMHSLVGTANKVWPHNVQHRSPMSPCQRLGVHNDTRLTIFTLPEGSRHPPKGANNPTADLPRKEIEVGSEGGTTLGSALTYRKVIIDHFSSKMTSNGPPVPKAIVSGNMEVATGNRMSNVLIETENLSQKTSGCTEHINIAWSLCDKRRRKSGELSAASCRPRVVKKHTKEILETVNIPTDLLVTQRQQLVRMTPLILLDKMETQPESKLTNDDQDLESSSELRDIHPQNAPVNGLPWEQTETHSIHKPPNDLSQLEPMESRSCCKSDRSHSQPKSIESCSCEPTENQSLCKSLNSHHQYASLENHSCESMETHSQHNPINSHSLPEKTPLRCESTCTNPQRDSLGSRSQPYPFSEEDSFPEIQADRNIFWEVPSEELTIDLMKKSKDLLSRNLLHMFPLEERECPYCPDKFHTGIGLANHVRGHLKRVGISYNTRHFVSAEEVTAIEKQFSLQKLKRKALKFRGGVVEKCNLCGASFDSRAGMSSHARAHLRELGVVTWSATSSPIDLLNELLQDQLPPGPADGQPATDATSRRLPNHRSGAATAVPEASSPHLLGKPFTSVNHSSPPQRNKVVIIDPDDDEEMATLELDLPSGLSSGETELQEKNGFMETLDSNSHPKQSLSKIALVSQGEESLQSNKLLNSCQLCGTCFETRKGLSSHARFHLRQFGVPDSESSGAPIGTLYELMKRKGIPNVLPSALSNDKPQSYAPKDLSSLTQEALGKPLGEECQGEAAQTAKSPKLGMNSPTKGQSQTSTLKKVHPILPKPVSSKSPEPGKTGRSLMNTPQTSGELLSKKLFWSPQDDNTPLNLIDQPSKDVRCEFCGEYFENRKGLSSHARSHLRQFGVTEWTVNGSPIDTLKELMKRKEKPEPLGHDPEQQEPQSYQYEEKHISKPFGQMIKSPVKEMHQKHLTPPARKVLTYTPNSQHSTLSPLGKKIPMGFVSTAPLKKSMPDERSMPHELKASYSPESGSYKPKSAWSPHEKVTTTPVIAADTCCELCGHYFENRKALASHARAHLRQFGVTEWHINGSPIDTLREWIRQKPNISPGTSLNCVQDRPLPKPIRNNIKSLVKELPGELCSLPGGKTVKLEPMQPKTVELGFPASPVQKNPETEKMSPTECYTPTDLSQSSITECTPSSSMPSEDEEPHPKKKRKHPVKLGTCEYCGVTLTTGVGLSNHMRGHLKSGLKRKLPSLSQFEELHEKAEPALTDTYNERKQQKPAVCTENLSPKHEEGKEPKTFRSKSEEPKPLRVRPVIFPVLKPEPLSLVKFIGNIYTLKCRFCDVEFHGPLSIQEEWVRHLQRHILDVNFPKVEAAREEISTSAEPEK
ncbi:protein Wiz-like isoform X6 [Narcine bancroftii]|uniref:protein Wiz-like isoform X6 n=1 Tax=Narcine bancroftii TaxID=1343680 RepID=UPI0038313D39